MLGEERERCLEFSSFHEDQNMQSGVEAMVVEETKVCEEQPKKDD